ncbi:hypothetical protein ACPUVO_19000 [Pseudocolwellia sp. HL-MZ19]|uniref:hypothetical protein n=1 Tax=Pseudocolwellia sp. HL-MZ19 TaxID=3400846 RepID=UPI003CFBB49E
MVTFSVLSLVADSILGTVGSTVAVCIGALAFNWVSVITSGNLISADLVETIVSGSTFVFSSVTLTDCRSLFSFSVSSAFCSSICSKVSSVRSF